MIDLVESYDEVLENAVTFSEELRSNEKIIRKLSNFKHWYYFSEIDKFAPSKFIGYKNMTCYKYNDCMNGLDGRDTERKLKEWFAELNGNEKKQLISKLNGMLAEFDKVPRKDFCIHVKKQKV